jgi:hypothetical protein
MNIDEKYGLFPIPKQYSVPTDAFPKPLHDRLVGALTELTDCWLEMNVDAFRHDDVVFLRVTLDVGDRPLYLYLHQDGGMLKIDAPVLLNFPREASHFVLKNLCGSSANLCFRIDEKDVRIEERGKNRKPSVRKIEILYGSGNFELDVFVESAHARLPFLVAKYIQAEEELRAFLDRQAQDPVSLDGPLSA